MEYRRTAGSRPEIWGVWNQTARTIPPGNVCQWFEENAKKTPNAVAAEDDQGRLTYGELHERTRRLARRLKSKSAGPDVPVAIYMERSLDMLTAMLAILKSGSAYLPLDPAYPETRPPLHDRELGRENGVAQRVDAACSSDLEGRIHRIRRPRASAPAAIK